ncbi:MAG TPA: YigZ family protein [Thermoanaerobaculia bacterium]|nr:YigZ family protein [Thermoanaerobaculia bacterium]
MLVDHFRTLAAPAELRQKIERSEFLGLAFPASGDESFFASLAQIQKRHFDATRHCWAFRLFSGGEGRERSSDAGEPSGTAGKPILSAIAGAELYDAGVVVVRWYGGVKLGSGGLTRAYRDTSSRLLSSAALAERYVYERFEVVVPFPMLNLAYRLVDPPAVVLEGEQYGETNRFAFDVRLSRAEDFARGLAERRFSFTRDPTPRLR